MPFIARCLIKEGVNLVNYCSEVDIPVSQRSVSIGSFIHTNICCSVRYMSLCSFPIKNRGFIKMYKKYYI